MSLETDVSSLRAIEALRAGVPNQDAVREIGTFQSAILERFRRQLAAVREEFLHGAVAEGTLVTGGFGSGKSHLLEYLQHIALQNNFVRSKVVISKETPLYDPVKVYNAAIQSAKVPGRAGAALTEIAHQLDFNSQGYTHFLQWVKRPDDKLSAWFAATTFVFEHSKGGLDPGVSDHIIQFWSGNPIRVGDLRGWLRDCGGEAHYKINTVPAKELALQRYRFAPRMMVAAGYAGWVILIDEVELIGRYSLKQRARSYAEIARLMGRLEGEALPGLTSVFAITDDFESAIIRDRNDEEKIPMKLGMGGELLLVSQAKRGMRIIQRDKMRLKPPTEETARESYNTVAALYAKAYGWNPPADYQHPDKTKQVRQYIKQWINTWDLKRLYPGYNPEIETVELKSNYSEMPELETHPGDET